MKKILWEIFRFFLALVVIASLAQHIWLFLFITPAYKDLFSTKDRRSIHLTIKVEDQFGKVVPDYEFKMKLGYRHWYFWLFPHPFFSGGNKIVKLKTNENGIARLSYLFKKAYSIQMLEGNNRERYTFGQAQGRVSDMTGKIKTGPGFGETALWQQLDPKHQELILRVLRHDPSAKLTFYKPEIKLRKDGHLEGFEAKDENVFTLNIEGNELVEGEAEGDVLVKIVNIKSACEAFRKRVEDKNEAINDSNGWNIIIEGQKRLLLKEADEEVITFAPTQGYKQIYEYHCSECGSNCGFSKGYYLEDDLGKWYGVLKLEIMIDPWKEKITFLPPICVYNSTGSHNLWFGKVRSWKYIDY